MPWVTPTSVSTGDVLQASKWNQEVVDNTSDLDTRVRSLKTIAKNRVAVNSTGSSWANPTSFTEIPQADDRAALNISFTKVGGTSTNLVIGVYGSVLFTSGASQVMTWGVRVGATSYTVAAILFPGATARVYFGGTTMITGLAAGTYSIDPMLRSAGAAALTLQAANDTVSIWVSETFA